METIEAEPREVETEKEEVTKPLKTPVREIPPTELFAVPSDEPKSEAVSVADKFPQRRAGLLSKSLDVLKKKTPSSHNPVQCCWILCSTSNHAGWLYHWLVLGAQCHISSRPRCMPCDCVMQVHLWVIKQWR